MADYKGEYHISSGYFSESESGKCRLKRDAELCIYCSLCFQRCPQKAIFVKRTEKTWRLNSGICTECGNCVSVCPKGALSIH